MKKTFTTIILIILLLISVSFVSSAEARPSSLPYLQYKQIFVTNIAEPTVNVYLTSSIGFLYPVKSCKIGGYKGRVIKTAFKMKSCYLSPRNSSRIIRKLHPNRSYKFFTVSFVLSNNKTTKPVRLKLKY